MSRVLFNDSEKKAVKLIQESLKRDGLSYDIIGNGGDSYEGIEMEISNVFNNGEKVYATVSVEAGGDNTIDRTMFSTISNDDELEQRLIKIIENTVTEIKRKTPKSVHFEIS